MDKATCPMLNGNPICNNRSGSEAAKSANLRAIFRGVGVEQLLFGPRLVEIRGANLAGHRFDFLAGFGDDDAGRFSRHSRLWRCPGKCGR